MDLAAIMAAGKRRFVIKQYSGTFGNKKSKLSVSQQEPGVFRFSSTENPCTIVVVDVATLEVQGSVFDKELDKKDVENSVASKPALYVINNNLNFVVRDTNHPWFLLKFSLLGDDEAALKA